MRPVGWRAGQVGAACASWAALVMCPWAYAEPVTYTLLPEHSFVQFEVMHFGTSTSRGRFGPLQGEVTLDRKKRQGEVALRINTAGVDTGLGIFNARLREPDLLASTQFPEAYFVARSFVFDGDRVAELRGEFTLRGVSQGLTLKALRFGCRRDDKPGEICGGDFEGEVKRSDFGATFGLPLVSDRVRLVVQVEGRR
jgi:polyisoprenoid-binding protein YceI